MVGFFSSNILDEIDYLKEKSLTLADSGLITGRDVEHGSACALEIIGD